MLERNVETGMQAEQKQHFKWEERKPLRKVKLSGDFFISKQLDSNLPIDKAEEPIFLKFPGRVATLGDIVFLLEQKDIPVSYNWTVYEDASITSVSVSDSDDDIDFDEEESSYSSGSSNGGDPVSAINSLENRIVPFKTYKGNLKGLLNRLKRSMNISYWWEDGTIFLSTNQEYVVSVPQQQDVIDSIVSEIEALGATNVTSSLTAGQIVYYSKPRAQSNLIGPFLRRISHNLSEITLQVALVQVDITGAESKGFDWDTFNMQFTSPSAAANNTNSITIDPYNGDTSNSVGSVSSTFLRKGISIFGTKTDVTIGMAINILSRIGKTTTEQNVEMRTISGKEVTMESVQEESYVSGYDGGTTGDNAEPASPEFDTVETGLTLTFLPVFDAYNTIVTIDASIDLSARLSDTTTTVNTGTEFGDQVTVRPNIKKDSFEDIVRIPVGETVILGGLINETFEDNRTAPMGAWSVNSAKQTTTKEALFLIIRPLVTLYETEGNEANFTEEDILKKTKYNYGKAIEKKAEDEKKAKEEAERKKAEALAAAKAKVDQKALELAKERELKAKKEAEIQEKLEAMRAKLEAEHKAAIERKEKEAKKLKEEMQEHKKAREVLEAESAWEEKLAAEEAWAEESWVEETTPEENNWDEEEWEEEIIIPEPKEIVREIIIKEETKAEIPLSDEEARKIEMLNMIRGIKN
jgi:hypothetical protein